MRPPVPIRARAAWTEGPAVLRPGPACSGRSRTQATPMPTAIPTWERAGRSRASGASASPRTAPATARMSGMWRSSAAASTGSARTAAATGSTSWTSRRDSSSTRSDSGIANFGSGNVAVNFASVPSEPSSIDLNNDGLLDFAYFGDLLGQMWRLDLRDMKIGSGAPADRWSSKLQKGDGSALSPMLLFQAPQPGGVSTQYFPIYYRPSVVYLGLTSAGQPILGIAIRHGRSRRHHREVRRFDPLDLLQPALLLRRWTRRIRRRSPRARRACSRSQAPRLPVPRPTPRRGGTCCWVPRARRSRERVITDTLAISKYIYMFTESPAAGSSGGSCPPPSTCKVTGGPVRQYTMYFANGNPMPAVDRPGGNPIPNASFATNPIFYISGGPIGQYRLHDQSRGLLAQQDRRAHALQHQGLERKLTVSPWPFPVLPVKPIATDSSVLAARESLRGGASRRAGSRRAIEAASGRVARRCAAGAASDFACGAGGGSRTLKPARSGGF